MHRIAVVGFGDVDADRGGRVLVAPRTGRRKPRNNSSNPVSANGSYICSVVMIGLRRCRWMAWARPAAPAIGRRRRPHVCQARALAAAIQGLSLRTRPDAGSLTRSNRRPPDLVKPSRRPHRSRHEGVARPPDVRRARHARGQLRARQRELRGEVAAQLKKQDDPRLVGLRNRMEDTDDWAAADAMAAMDISLVSRDLAVLAEVEERARPPRRRQLRRVRRLRRRHPVRAARRLPCGDPLRRVPVAPRGARTGAT